MTPEEAPEKARELLSGTDPGPWEWRWDAGLISLFDAKGESVATDLEAQNVALVAAAPTLARMVAGMRAEYRAEYQNVGGHWFPTDHCRSYRNTWVTKQEAERNAADWKTNGYPTRIVRRYVTTPEEA